MSSMQYYNSIVGSQVKVSGDNVGIGTSNPTGTLDVSGIIIATSGNSTQWNTAYGWGDHSLSGYLVSGSNISLLNNNVPYAISGTHIAITNAASNVNNSSNDFVQDLLFDEFGHVTGVVSETVTDNDVNTFATGLTFNSGNNNLVLTRNDSVTVTGNLQGVLVSGTTYHTSISAASSSDNSDRTYIQDILLDSNGHVIGITTATETGVITETNDLSSSVTWVNVPDANITESSVIQHSGALRLTESQIVDLQNYLTSFTETNNLSSAVTWANVPDSNITQSSVIQHTGALRITESQIVDLQNYLTSHPTIGSAASSSDNSGRTYIQDILLDSNGHVTGITTATETVTDTNTEYTAGTGLDLSGTEFNIDSTVLTTGSSLGDLSDVDFSSGPATNEVLRYSNATSKWLNGSIDISIISRGSLPFGGYSSTQMGHYFYFDSSAGEAVINTDGDDVNFRVEGTGNNHLFFVDAGTERVGINNSAPSHTLDISGMARVVHPDGLCGLQIEDEGGSGVHIGDCAYSVGPTYAGMQHSAHNSSSEYMIISRGDHTFLSAKDGYGVIIRGGNNNANCEIRVYDANVSGQNAVVINELGSDRDMRIEGLVDSVFDYQNLFKVDASANSIGIGTGTPAYKLDVAGTFSADSVNVNNQYTLPTADGSAGQSLVTDGAGNIVFSGVTGGAGGSGNLVRGSEAVTVTTGLFDVSGGYNVGTLDVYQNGIKLFEGASYDYTATNGLSFSLNNTATSGDLIEYIGLNTSTNAVGDTSLGTITVTSSQDVFNTSDTFTSASLAVFLNGVKLVAGIAPGDYQVTSTSQFTLNSPAASGDVVEYIAYGATVASSNLQKTGDTMTGNLTVNADLIVRGYKETHTDNGNTGTSQTIDISSSTLQTYTLTGNCTFTMPTPEAGRSFTMLLKTGAGSLTATFTGAKFPLNTAPTITTDANRMDLITFYSDGTNWYGNIQQEYHV